MRSVELDNDQGRALHSSTRVFFILVIPESEYSEGGGLIPQLSLIR